MQTQHVPVMLEEVLKFLQPGPGGFYIDGTLGSGGHTEAILEQSAPDGEVVGIDTDPQALARVGERLARMVAAQRLILVHGNFAELGRIARVDKDGDVIRAIGQPGGGEKPDLPDSFARQEFERQRFAEREHGEDRLDRGGVVYPHGVLWCAGARPLSHC